MNPATALARVLVDELVRGGVREAVLSPGSRSAPLAFALHAADARGELRLHVRIDERSAGFLALGLAKASRVPVPVVTTSGTAVANLHPAVLEASHAQVPLLLLTADRPPELRGVGANQTVDQVGIFGSAVRWSADVAVPEERAGQMPYWRSTVVRALAAASGDAGSAPGPVQLNLGLREPLVPGGDEQWVEPLDGRAGALPWTQRVASVAAAVADDLPARTVLVLGDGPPGPAAAGLRLAQARGWPVVAEPSSGVVPGPGVVDAAELVVGAPGFLEAHLPERVLVIGRPTLSRVVARLVGAAPVDVVGAHGGWPDPSRRAVRVLPGVPEASGGAVSDGWLAGWQVAGQRARAAIDAVLDARTDLTEPVVAAEVLAAATGLLFVGSSKPVRDLFLAGTGAGRVLANRGVAGIDGTVSTATGAALADQRAGGGRTFALLGDLTFLHDTNGLLVGPEEPRPDLTLVVVNNDGGAIFGLLEQGDPEHAGAFERVFGTRHGTDLAALCAATRTAHVRVMTREGLRTALGAGSGTRVVEVRTDRTAAVALDRELRAAVAVAVA